MKKWYDLALETCKEIVSACKNLPVGFSEDRVGENLPGTQGYMLEVRRHSDGPMVHWSNGKNWSYGRKECSLYECCLERDGVSYIQKEFTEAEGIALIKAGEGLLKWLRDAAKQYELNEGD